jgi:hypothetical protein
MWISGEKGEPRGRVWLGGWKGKDRLGDTGREGWLGLLIQ